MTDSARPNGGTNSQVSAAPIPVEQVGALRDQVVGLKAAVDVQYIQIDRLARQCDMQQHLIDRTRDYLSKILDGPLDNVTETVARAALAGLTKTPEGYSDVA